MNAEYVTVYDQSGDMLGVLENAGDIGYNLPQNDLWTGSFSLPSNDPKNSYCQAYNLIHLRDGARDTGLYRIIGMPTGEITATGGVRTYSLEHVMATLLDDILFGYHEIGGVGVTTAQVMQYILARQTTGRWVFGGCDFSDQYAYKFENTSLLSALLSLGGVLTEEYTWVFNTSVTPWEVSLKRADATPGCGIHYMRNMVGIEKTIDGTQVTRLYLLGYGEGVNQLTVRDVNGGLPYIDADNIDPHYPKCGVFVDTRIEDAATLKARGLAVLEKLKVPYVTYTATAIDWARVTGQSWDTYMPGKLVRVMDGEHSANFDARIVNVSKSDIGGRPGEIEITIANQPRDAADSINTLADRLGINELYSQGATNLYSQQYADNADASHPALMRVYVPNGCVRINQMLLSWSIEAFRAYETGAEAGGATATTTSSGGQSTSTSSSGGGSERTSSSSGQAQVTKPQSVVSSAGGTGGPLSGNGTVTDGNTSSVTLQTDDCTTSTGYAYYAGEVKNVTGDAGAHSHTGPSHTHSMNGHTHSFSGSDSVANGHTHKVTCASSGTVVISQGVSTNGTHSVSISGTTGGNSNSTGSGGTGSTGENGSHNHNMQHWHPHTHKHSIGAHYHNFSHVHNVVVSVTIPAITVNVPAHTHTVSIDAHTHTVSIPAHTHDVTLGNHTHDIKFGIYEGSSASNVAVYVDDTQIPAASLSASEMDIVQYLTKDADGKITRGAWHEIKIVPNALTRIEANLFVQAFVQSVGGGDY